MLKILIQLLIKKKLLDPPSRQFEEDVTVTVTEWDGSYKRVIKWLVVVIVESGEI